MTSPHPIHTSCRGWKGINIYHYGTFISTPSPQQEDLLSKVIAVSDSAQASRQDEAASLEAIDPRGEPVARVAADIVGHLQCAHRLEAPPIG